MPKHTEATPHLLGAQILMNAIPLPAIHARVDELAANLSSLLVTTYDVEHADEHLEWIVTALRDVADRLEHVRPYTREGARRENARSERIFATIEARDDFIQRAARDAAEAAAEEG